MIELKGIETQLSRADDIVELIRQYTGRRFETEIALDVWPRIMQHKWFLSEKRISSTCSKRSGNTLFKQNICTRKTAG